MKLTEYQISKIDKTVSLNLNKFIVMVDVTDDNSVAPAGRIANIYCVDAEYEIIWQVEERKTTPPFKDDSFVYLEKDDQGQVVADRFSGFEYVIDLTTGEAEQVGYHK